MVRYLKVCGFITAKETVVPIGLFDEIVFISLTSKVLPLFNFIERLL